MKKFFTLAAAGVLTAAAVGAQAQTITINGQLAASEIGATGYQLVGRDTGPRPGGFGDAGILSVYAASDANNLYFFIAGTLESGSGGISNSIQLFIDRPGVAGVPVGTALPGVTTPTGLSFEQMTARLDLAADIAVAIRGTGAANEIAVEGVAYTSGTAATGQVLTGSTPASANGTAVTVPAASVSGPLAGFAGAQVAYTTSANLSSNPGFASVGGAGSNGLEISVSRAAMGLPAAGGSLQIFAVQNNREGGFLSSDYIPQNTGPLPTNAGYPTGTSGNLGGPQNGTPNVVDFSNIPGTQAATLVVTATGLTVLSSKQAAADAAVAMSVFPNPTAGEATVSYRVLDKSQKVDIVLTDLMGRTIRVVHSGTVSVGTHREKLDTQNVAAGTYLLKTQVGEKIATRKVVLL